METAVETSRVYWIGNLSALKQRPWGDTPLCMADIRQDTGSSLPLGEEKEEEVTNYWGIDVRWAH